MAIAEMDFRIARGLRANNPSPTTWRSSLLGASVLADPEITFGKLL